MVQTFIYPLATYVLYNQHFTDAVQSPSINCKTLLNGWILGTKIQRLYHTNVARALLRISLLSTSHLQQANKVLIQI